MDQATPPVLLLICGLPGAGKTTLARRVEREAAAVAGWSSDWRVQRVSFDDLFRADGDAAAEFDPIAWKRCQREMAACVRASQAARAQGSRDDRPLVLLVDDNFQYRSLRKRFAHLAAEVDCGFGVLHVITPLKLCRERNAARAGVERVPDAVFERMASAFEAPGSEQHAFERNTAALSLDESLDASAMFDVLAALVRNAIEILSERRRIAALDGQDKLQREQDQMRTHKDVVHHVDLQLRKWISSALQQPSAAGASSSSSSSSSKAELAQRLNHARKAFLTQLKPRTRDETASTGSAIDVGVDVDAAVAAHVERFQFQHRSMQRERAEMR